MNKKTKKSPIPERIMILDDFTPFIEAKNEGRLTAAESEAIFSEARYTGLMNGEDADEYIRIFGKPDFFIGASNAGVIAQLSPYMNRYYLQLEKTRQVVKAITPATEWRFALGHESEPFVASVCTRKLNDMGIDVRFIDYPYGVVNTLWPQVLIHPDILLLDNKTGAIRFLGEIKTSHWKSLDWVMYFSVDKVPPHYDAQAQVMMRVLDIKECYFFVWNKTGDEDGFKAILVKRDDKKAEKYLDEMEKFYEDTVNGIYYDDDELLPDEASAIYTELDETLGYVELPKKHKKYYEQIADLLNERAALKAEISEQEADIREINKQIKLIKSRFYGSIKKAPGGTFVVGDDQFRVDVRRSFRLNRDVLAEMETRHPELQDIWEQMKGISPLVSSRIVKISGDEAVEIDNDEEF